MRLISIIGEDISQLVPMLYAYRTSISEHLLLAEAAFVPTAKRLLRGMEQFSRDHRLGWRVALRSIDESDLVATAEQITDLLRIDPQKSWLSIGSTYPMLTLLLGETIRQHGGEVISYDLPSNTVHFLTHAQQLSCMKLSSSIDLVSYLTLLGYRMTAGQTRADLLPHKSAVKKLYADQSRFKKLRYALLYPDQNSGFEYGFYRDLLQVLEQMGIVKGERLIPSQQKVLSGDLFEMYLFWLCEALGVDDIAMGVKIDFDDESEPLSQRRIVNEFDILIMHHNRLSTIECKYSTHLDGLELIYKYDAIIDYFGPHTRAIIANLSSKPKEPYMDTKSSSNFRHSALRRAHRSNIAIYHETQLHEAKFQAMVRSFFEIGGK
jgi:hypothetical protein